MDTERNRKYELIEIVNAILYLVKTGCQWRMLPGDFRSWKLVYYYFSTFKKNGTIEIIHESLVEDVRLEEGRKDQSTAGIIDVQSVKSMLVGSQEKGYDAGKKIKGIKRHIILCPLRLIIAVDVQSASV